ncbi:hypothetical protein [Phaeospirillum tilakii]|uniref:Immunity protein 53 n=1 Tax=Phaeospirillum tilakii TaxID=741673 RepID=A0ABW5CD47_9PROT
MATIADALSALHQLSKPGAAHHSYDLGSFSDSIAWRIDYPSDGYNFRDEACAQNGARSTTITLSASYPQGPAGDVAIRISAVDRRKPVAFNDEPRGDWLIGDLPTLGATKIALSDIETVVLPWLRDHGCPV